MSVRTHIIIGCVLLCSGPRAFALTGSAMDAQMGGFGLVSPTPTPVSVGALQLVGGPTHPGFGLSGDAASLVGSYGVTAKQALATLAPQLLGCTPRLLRSEGAGLVVHESYELDFGGYPLAHASLQLHRHAGQLVMVRAAMPDYQLPADPWTDADFLPLATLGFPDARPVRRVIANSGGLPAPAWEAQQRDLATGATTRLLIDAETGAILENQREGFDLASVYEHGPADGRLVTVDLPDLPGTGYLDGRHFAVYAPTPADPRVEAPDNVYNYRPDDPADALNFDQVEVYYGATRALAWFQSKFGYDPGNAQVHISINTEISGNPDNALYIPPPEGPAIEIGRGDELTNLARDTDVVSHEFAHHVIWQHLKSHNGESGVLHEGTADYFAYAINGDPYLGESVVPGKPYLRTAALDPALRYDEIAAEQDAHYRGQFWSAVLWDLRARLGTGMDQMVYDSLAYLGETSGLTDAFLALLNADRDLNPLPQGASEAGVYGKNKCLILETALQRGFAAYLGGLDGASCGLDLTGLAQASRERTNGEIQGHGKDLSLTAFGHKCAVVALPGQDGGAPFARLLLALMLALPLAGAALGGTRRRKVDDGSR